MKLLIFCPYYPPHIGGLESHADEFNKYLSQEGVDITVFTPRFPKDAIEKEIRYANVKIIRFPAFEIIDNYPLPKLWTFKFWHLFLGLFNEESDVVISRTRFFTTSLIALIYAKIRSKKWVHIEHGSDFVKLDSRFKSNIAKLYDYTFGKLIFILADKIISNSKSSAQFCKKIAPKINCEIIYRGVEIDKIESIKPNLELKNKYKGETIITFIGRLIDGKGVIDLINTVKNINGEFKLFIVGDGIQKVRLEKLVKELEIENKVVFFGYKKFEEAIGILKISDIFINPSYTEGLPTSVVEAAICRKAIIATNVGGTPEIFTNGKSGILVNPKDIQSLSDNLNLLINNRNLRENLGKIAYTEAMDKFDWSKSTEKYLSIFKKNVY